MRWLALAAALSLPAGQSAVPVPQAVRGVVEEQITLPAFGKVSVYRPDPIEKTRGVILFVSGDGGWNLGVVEMARRTAGRSIVVGLSLPAWRKRAELQPDHCWYPAGDLESTAQAVEKIYKLPRYLRPILVGYSSGATLVYGALAQAPAAAFAGAVSLGFCPDLEVARPLCPRAGWKPSYDPGKRTSLLPAPLDLSTSPNGGARWTVLQGEVDQVCDPAAVKRFAAGVAAARVVSLPKVGHGFSAPRNWGSAFDDAVETLLKPGTAWQEAPGEAAAAPRRFPEEIGARIEALGLPLEIHWPEGAHDVVIFVSGDGGWAELDQTVASRLSAGGVAVVGLNSLRYFWSARRPDSFAADLSRLIEVVPEGMRVFAGGYSFGAEVVPATLARLTSGSAPLPAPLARIAGLILLAPGRYAAFEISPLDWIRSGGGPTDDPVREAIRAVSALPVLCMESSPQEESGCPPAAAPGLTRVTMPGGHHFAGDFTGLAYTIMGFIKSPGAL